MKLYELATNYRQVSEMLEGEDDIALKDTLESIEDEIEDKAENIAKMIRNLEADVKAYKEEEQRLANHRRTIENRITGLKGYLQDQLEIAGLNKVKRPTLTVSIQNNPPSVDIADENNIPSHFRIPQPDKIDRKAILSHLKDGVVVDGATLKQSRSVRIR